MLIKDACVNDQDDSMIFVGSLGTAGIILKIGQTGDIQWAYKSTDAVNDSPAYSVACSLNTFAYLAGDTLSFPYLTATAGNRVVYVVKYSISNGDRMWVKSIQ